MNKFTLRCLLFLLLEFLSSPSFAREIILFAESPCKGAYEYHFLNRAAHSNDQIGLELLLKSWANIDGKGYEKYPDCVAGFEYSSPLMVATYANNIEIVKILLNLGANPNIREGEGETPIEVAREKGFKEIVNLLIKHGAK